MEPKPGTHEDRIRTLCFLITSTFNNQHINEKTKYQLIIHHAVDIELEAEDKLARG